jgi:hypothetical protein
MGRGIWYGVFFPRCLKNRLPGAYFGSKARDFNALDAQNHGIGQGRRNE